MKCRPFFFFLKIVDTSDKQAMARRYHKLDRDQVRTLKILSGKTEPDDNAPIEIPRKSKNKVAPGKKKMQQIECSNVLKYVTKNR